jgi:hypothetical protein
LHPLGGEIRIRRSEVVIEDRLFDDGDLVARERDAAEGVLDGKIDPFVSNAGSSDQNDRLQLVELVRAITGVPVHARRPLPLRA